MKKIFSLISILLFASEFIFKSLVANDDSFNNIIISKIDINITDNNLSADQIYNSISFELDGAYHQEDIITTTILFSENIRYIAPQAYPQWNVSRSGRRTSTFVYRFFDPGAYKILIHLDPENIFSESNDSFYETVLEIPDDKNFYFDAFPILHHLLVYFLGL